MSDIVNIPGSQSTTGVFISPQSLTTFPVATSVTTMMWKMSAQIYPALGTNKLVPVFIAMLMGLIIYFYSESPSVDLKDKFGEAFIGLLNSMMIASAALGIMTF